MNNINKLIARWNTDEGKPYKGSLIDMGSYEEGNLSCMCAQGQVLHVVGGWDAGRLSDTKQAEADKATAKLLNISRAHAVLLRNTNDKIDGAPAIVLTDPAKVIGDRWSKLLDFWWYMDTLDAAGWRKVAAWDAARYAARDAAWDAAGDAAGAAAGYAAGAAAGYAARDAAWDAAGDAAGAAAGYAAGAAAGAAAGYAARDASSEIQGAEILKRDGKPFYFLLMFGFASPDEIPARPADYGVMA
jgi:hypothetical protein